MVQDYITPEGKFELVLFGKQFIIETEGRKTNPEILYYQF